jgi:hypothetical protein
MKSEWFLNNCGVKPKNPYSRWFFTKTVPVPTPKKPHLMRLEKCLVSSELSAHGHWMKIDCRRVDFVALV